MADKKISELPVIQTISGSTVVVPMVHDGTTIQIPIQRLGLFISQFSATTGSNTFIGNQTINGNLTLSGNGVIGGNVEVGGMITAQQYNVTYVSSSVQYQSGSTQFGDTIDDTHTITGTLILNGLAIGTAELMAFTGSQIGKDLTLSVLTSSIDSHILAQATQTGSQDLVNYNISIVTSSIDAHILGISIYTASANTTNTSIDAHILAQSIQTASQDLVNLGISTYTGSQNVINSSVDAHILKQATQTGSQDLVNLGISSVTGSLIGITNTLMAFTAALDDTYATDAQLLPLLQATASIQFATASLNTQTGSQDLVNLSISTYTGSQNVINNSFDSHILVQATQTGSQDLVNLGISTFTGSIRSEVGLIEAYTASLKGAAIVSSSTQITNLGFITSSQSASFNFIGFNTSAGVSVGVGQLAWNNSDGTLDLGMKGGNVVQQIGQEIFYEVRNETGIQIPNGTAVFANGVTAGSGRITVAPYTADGSVREVRFLGLATENISTGINGFVTHFGYVRGLDTRGDVVSSIAVGDETWAVGDILYVHPTVAGKLTNVKPEHAITVAIIITRHQSVGVLFVRPSTGGHLEDIHDILINTGSLTNGQVLAYNSTSGLWENTNQINTSSFATTGSNIFIGNQIISGSLTVSGSNTFTNIGRTELTGSVEVDGDIGVYGNITVVQKTIEVLGFPTNQPAFYSEGDILLSGSLSIHVEELGQSFDVAEQFQQAFSSISFTQGELEIISSSYATTGSNIFVGNQSITGSLRLTGSLKLGDWFHGEGVTNNAPIDIRTTVDRGLNVDGTVSSDVIITAYQGAVSDKIRTMRLQGSAINIFTGDGNANTGSYIGGFNTNGLAFESGKGIDFSATSNGSGTMTSELLNDYEEGTWVIGIEFGGASVDVTTSTNTGTYTKIGRQVTVKGGISLTSKGSSAGIAEITGLPFTIGATTSNHAPASLWLNNVTFANQYQARGLTSGVKIRLEELTEAGVLTNIEDTNFANNSEVFISLTYFV